MVMKAFLVDDESLALKRLQRMLAVTGRVEIAGTSTDPVEAVEAILKTKPDVLFLDDPARGIDVAAKEDIYALMQELTANGKSIILASSELAELLRCADRILVLCNGRVSGIFPARAVTQESIITAAARANCA